MMCISLSAKAPEVLLRGLLGAYCGMICPPNVGASLTSLRSYGPILPSFLPQTEDMICFDE
jgi:hypothetical protein